MKSNVSRAMMLGMGLSALLTARASTAQCVPVFVLGAVEMADVILVGDVDGAEPREAEVGPYRSRFAEIRVLEIWLTTIPGLELGDVVRADAGPPAPWNRIPAGPGLVPGSRIVLFLKKYDVPEGLFFYVIGGPALEFPVEKGFEGVRHRVALAIEMREWGRISDDVVRWDWAFGSLDVPRLRTSALAAAIGHQPDVAVMPIQLQKRMIGLISSGELSGFDELVAIKAVLPYVSHEDDKTIHATVSTRIHKVGGYDSSLLGVIHSIWLGRGQAARWAMLSKALETAEGERDPSVIIKEHWNQYLGDDDVD